MKKRYGPFADRLLKAYPTAADAVPKTARDLARDSAFGWHTWVWARLQSEHGKAKAYYYYFDQHPDYPAGSPEAGHGSPHGADVAYVFEHLTTFTGPPHPRIERISDAMAATGPTSPNTEIPTARRSSVARVQRRESSGDVLCRDSAYRACSQCGVAASSGRLLRLEA